MNSLPDIQEVKDQSISKGPSAVRVYKIVELPVKSEKKGIAQNLRRMGIIPNTCNIKFGSSVT